MRTARTRLPKNFSLERFFTDYARAIEVNPARFAGSWATWNDGIDGTGKPWREVRLDLGCGKGPFTVECAQAEPEVLFVGIDIEAVCVAYAARRAVEAGVDNAVFITSDGLNVTNLFGPGELSCIYLNFPTPYHRTKDAAKRLTYLNRLMAYRELLTPEGLIRFQTDSQPLRDFSLTQFELAGYEVTEKLDDARSVYPYTPWTEYERRAADLGGTTYLTVAKPGPAPEQVEQTAPLGLVAYLPDNLDEMTYVPFGMEVTVRNLKIARAKGHGLG